MTVTKDRIVDLTQSALSQRDTETYHDTVNRRVVVGLEDSLFDSDTNAFTVHAFPSLANEPQLEMDTNLLASLAREL